jgi:hypothetical protein
MVRKVLRGTQNVKRRPMLATSLTCDGCRLDAMTRKSYPTCFRANIGDRLSRRNHLAMRTNRPLSRYAVGSWHGASSRDGMTTRIKMSTHRETVRLVIRLQNAGLAPSIVAGFVVVAAMTKAESIALADAIGDAVVTEG